jgi:hypothetical protein
MSMISIPSAERQLTNEMKGHASSGRDGAAASSLG